MSTAAALHQYAYLKCCTHTTIPGPLHCPVSIMGPITCCYFDRADWILCPIGGLRCWQAGIAQVAAAWHALQPAARVLLLLVSLTDSCHGGCVSCNNLDSSGCCRRRFSWHFLGHHRSTALAWGCKARGGVQRNSSCYCGCFRC
jgi:hypothetical protein